MKMNKERTIVKFDNKVEFENIFNFFELTLFGCPCVFDFTENPSLTFKFNNGIVYQIDENYKEREVF